MKKTAVLLDLGFVLHKLSRLLDRSPTAIEIRDFARKCLNPFEEELFRIYCYHCYPYGLSETHPLTKKQTNFAATEVYKGMSRLIRDLRIADNVAFRAGELSFDGWVLKKQSVADILKTGRSIAANDFVPDLKQKGVDMRIGLDVAWLASKSIVERLVLVTSDSDFIPAMKFARREGVQVVVVTLGHKQIKQEFLAHADELRAVTFP